MRRKNIGVISFVLFVIFLIIVSNSCSKNDETINKNETDKSSLEFVETADNKKNDSSNEMIESDNSYKYRDEISKLIEKEKIFNIIVDNNTNEKDISLHISLLNDRTNLKELDSIKIGLSVEEFEDELYTNIVEFNESKKYWEIKLKNGVLEEGYEIYIDNSTNLLSDEEKELLLENNKSIVLRFDIYVDEGNPVRIYNHFLNSEVD